MAKERRIVETQHGDFQVSTYFNDDGDNGLEVYKDENYIGTLPNHYEDFGNLELDELESLENEVTALYEDTF